MGKSQETFSKKEKEKKRLKKRKDKLAKREERKANPKKTFEESIEEISATQIRQKMREEGELE